MSLHPELDIPRIPYSPSYLLQGAAAPHAFPALPLPHAQSLSLAETVGFAALPVITMSLPAYCFWLLPASYKRSLVGMIGAVVLSSSIGSCLSHAVKKKVHLVALRTRILMAVCFLLIALCLPPGSWGRFLASSYAASSYVEFVFKLFRIPLKQKDAPDSLLKRVYHLIVDCFFGYISFLLVRSVFRRTRLDSNSIAVITLITLHSPLIKRVSDLFSFPRGLPLYRFR